MLSQSNILVWDYDIVTQMITLDYSDTALKERMTRDEFLKKRIPPLKYGSVNKSFDRLSAGEEENFSEEWELLSILEDGSQEAQYVMVNGMPLRNNSGKITAYSGLLRDIQTLFSRSIGWSMRQNELYSQTK
ncbi:hypothetical protein Bache_1754 [Bacteroides helcogenes P 36-108]|uniref:Uncharacterized protein n=2 Tax=Bacteroides helcogenes TaxID=290053 RepID=E6SNJ1_BACT6|nr:hypothetical protein Bache_1754 [Bacteroides helcogenes P 36-108]